MSATIRRYISWKEDFQYNRGYNTQQLEASQLRKQFLRKFIINFDTYLYQTQVERDWAYIAKREYRYDVQLNSLAYSIATANVVWSWRIFAQKRMVWWPLAIIPVAYFYFEPTFLQKHNKKLFDMCNVGEQYHLGKYRNQVLRQCNQILDRQDF